VNDGFHPEVLADGGPRDEPPVAYDFHDESAVDWNFHDELAVDEDFHDESAAVVGAHGESADGEVHDELAVDENPPGWDVDYCLPPLVPLHPLSLKYKYFMNITWNAGIQLLLGLIGKVSLFNIHC
jgi:hypothetical protein